MTSFPIPEYGNSAFGLNLSLPFTCIVLLLLFFNLIKFNLLDVKYLSLLSIVVKIGGFDRGEYQRLESVL